MISALTRSKARFAVSSIEPGPSRPGKVALVDSGYLTDRQLRRIIRRGLGLGMSMPPGETSLDFIEPLKDHLTYLVVTDWSCHDLRVLSDFTKLTYLDVQRTQPRQEIDLSRLTSLREYAGPGTPQCRSVLTTPSLESVYLDKSSDEDLDVITGSILDLRLQRAAGNTKVPRSRNFETLRQLWVTDAREFDLSTLAGLRDLELVRIWDCKRLTGLAAFADCPSLKELSIDGVQHIEDWEAVLGLDVHKVSLTNVKSLPASAASLIPEGRDAWTISRRE